MWIAGLLGVSSLKWINGYAILLAVGASVKYQQYAKVVAALMFSPHVFWGSLAHYSMIDSETNLFSFFLPSFLLFSLPFSFPSFLPFLFSSFWNSYKWLLFLLIVSYNSHRFSSLFSSFIFSSVTGLFPMSYPSGLWFFYMVTWNSQLNSSIQLLYF